MKVIFLDFDGVINTPMWDDNGERCRFYHAGDKKVNAFQAICLLNELCKKTDAKIVLSTSWKDYKNLDFLRELLYNSGLKKNIEIIGKTPRIRTKYCHIDRTVEIETYLEMHKEDNIENYVILDDDEIYGLLRDNFVKCNCCYGFKEPEFEKALKILNTTEKKAT